MKALLVWNGRSGAEDVARRERIIERLSPVLTLEVHDLAENESGEAVSRAAIDRGVELIIAAGGDGTVSTCASAALGTLATLGIVPCGTANSICRALGLPMEVDAACDALADATVRRIDAARIGGRAMVLVASIGFHADTIDSTPKDQKSSLGKLAYILRGIQHLRDFESFAVHIETDRGTTDLKVMALTIANLAPPESLFAHGPPAVVPDDGLLDLTVVAAETVLDALSAGIELAVSTLAGTEAGGPHVAWTRCTRARVVADPPQHVLVDGDVIGMTPLEIEIVPEGLAIAYPRPTA